MKSKKKPLITVVTVVMNGEALIEKTIKSVTSQSYPKIEYIIIDGGSTDGTIEIIKKYEKNINYWISEIDQGIYDAMNKALKRAGGVWISFMNAGDTFQEIETIEKIFDQHEYIGEILYGAVEILYADMSRIQMPGSPNKIWKGMQFSHQSAFVDVSYHKAHPFNIQNKIAADLEFFYHANNDNVEFCRVDCVVAKVITGGVSEKNRIRTIAESCRAVCGTKVRPLIRLYYFARIISSIFRALLKFLLPRYVVRKIILWK